MCPKNFGIDFSSVFTVNCNITVISLLTGNITECLSLSFPETLRCKIYPSAFCVWKYDTSQGFPGTLGQTFWYIFLEAINNLYHALYPLYKCLQFTLMFTLPMAWLRMAYTPECLCYMLQLIESFLYIDIS